MPNLDLTITDIMHGDTPVLKIMKGDIRKWPYVVSTYTISGIVTDGSNPLSGVLVALGNNSMTTGSDGAYSFVGVESGTYTLSASKSGYSFAPISLVVSNDVTQNIEMLPYDAEVEYLQSSGTQYIDTGVVLSKTYKIEAEVAVLSSNSGFCFVLSANTAGTNYSNPISFNTSGYAYVQVGGSTSYTTINGDVRDGVMRSYVSEGNGSKMYLTKDNTTVNKSISGSLSTLSMYMFATNHSVNNATNFLSAKIAKIKITISGVLVRDYIPVRVGTTGYMYDKVSGTLFGNAGSGSFTYGNDVT